MQPILAIELNDSSHKRQKAQEQDAKKDKVLEKIGLPIVRITAKNKYTSEKVATEILPYL